MDERSATPTMAFCRAPHNMPARHLQAAVSALSMTLSILVEIVRIALQNSLVGVSEMTRAYRL